MVWQTNKVELWRDDLPVPSPFGNKYDRGHAVIIGAPELTGATRLAASSCARVGAGLVTVAAQEASTIYRSSLPPEIMVRDDNYTALRAPAVILAGCGGVSPQIFRTLRTRFTDCFWVLDAEAIMAALSQAQGERLGKMVITPHQGEFDRSFPKISGSRVEQAHKVAKSFNSMVILKGPRTVIASPDGRIVVNVHASPYLASAGTGDVLAGLLAGLIAQAMPPFEACCAAVWIHGDAARRFGPGMVTSDIPNLVPSILGDILKLRHEATADTAPI